MQTATCNVSISAYLRFSSSTKQNKCRNSTQQLVVTWGCDICLFLKRHHRKQGKGRFWKHFAVPEQQFVFYLLCNYFLDFFLFLKRKPILTDLNKTFLGKTNLINNSCLFMSHRSQFQQLQMVKETHDIKLPHITQAFPIRLFRTKVTTRKSYL